jgi:hypothetical protein
MLVVAGPQLGEMEKLTIEFAAKVIKGNKIKINGITKLLIKLLYILLIAADRRVTFCGFCFFTPIRIQFPFLKKTNYPKTYKINFTYLTDGQNFSNVDRKIPSLKR